MAKRGSATEDALAKGVIRVVPLGGVGEVGKNATLVDVQGDLFLIDAGVKFPEEELLGIDLVIPDFTYLVEHVARLRAILLTHGHEDHIGALPFLLRQLGGRVPVYGAPLTLGFASVKLREQKLLERADLRPLAPGQSITLGKTQVEFIQVGHSVPDAVMVALHTPLGTVLHTGDFKFAGGANVPGLDVRRLRALGEQGVLALLSDCVRIEKPGRTPSESVVGETLDGIIRDAPGRVIVTSFASNIIRVQQVVQAAHRHGRKVAVTGRSLEANLEVARELGFVKAPPGAIVGVKELRQLPPNQVVLITTGSQGEPTSALARIAVGDHPLIQIIPGDTVVISATPVPGNEETVARTIDNLMRRGAVVIYPELVPTVHVSGHASRDELRELIAIVRPQYCVPLHGEYRHLVLYRAMAIEAGIPAERIFLADIGEVVELSPKRGRKAGKVPSGSVLVDGLTLGVPQTVLRDRRHLAADGVIIVAITFDRETGEIIAGPDIIARGFVEADGTRLLGRAAERVRVALRRQRGREIEYGFVVRKAKEVLEGFLYQETRSRPMILPVVTEV
ncbi:MAG TPA: ribonuclease J [Chloroflexota bacterium]